MRWTAEIDLRHPHSRMGLDVLLLILQPPGLEQGCSKPQSPHVPFCYIDHQFS